MTLDFVLTKKNTANVSISNGDVRQCSACYDIRPLVTLLLWNHEVLQRTILLSIAMAA